MPHKMAYATKIVSPTYPRVAAGAEALTGPFIPFDNFQHVTFIIQTNAVADAFTITFQQATNTAGGSEKTLGFTDIIHTAADGESFTEVDVTANSYTTIATAGRIHIIEFDSADLDVQNSFDHIQINLAGIANTLGISIVAIFSEGRYQGYDANQKPVSTFTPVAIA